MKDVTVSPNIVQGYFSFSIHHRDWEKMIPKLAKEISNIIKNPSNNIVKQRNPGFSIILLFFDC